jgi:hypothetical protein
MTTTIPQPIIRPVKDRTFKAEYLVHENDDGTVQLAILSVTHSKNSKALIARLYRVEREYDAQWTVDKFTVYGGTSVLLDTEPVARYSDKVARQFFDELVDLIAVADMPTVTRILTDPTLPH